MILVKINLYKINHSHRMNFNSNNVSGEVVVGLIDTTTTKIWSEVVVGFNDNATTNAWTNYVRDPYNTDSLISFVKYAIETNNQYAYKTIFLTEMKKLARDAGSEVMFEKRTYHHGIDIYFNLLVKYNKYNIIERLVTDFIKRNKKVLIKDEEYNKLSEVTEVIISIMDTNKNDTGLIIFNMFYPGDANLILSIVMALYNNNKIEICKDMLNTILSDNRPDLITEFIGLIKKRVDMRTLLTKGSVSFEPESSEKAKLYNEHGLLENVKPWEQYWRALNYSVDYKNPLEKEIIDYVNSHIDVSYFIYAADEYWDGEYVKEIASQEGYDDFFNNFGILFSHPELKHKCIELANDLYWEKFKSYPLSDDIVDECKKYVEYFQTMQTYEQTYNTSNNLKVDKVFKLNKINCNSLVKMNFESLRTHINKFIAGEKYKLKNN